MPAYESGCQSWAAHEPGAPDVDEMCLCVTTPEVFQPSEPIQSVREQRNNVLMCVTTLCRASFPFCALFKGSAKFPMHKFGGESLKIFPQHFLVAYCRRA